MFGLKPGWVGIMFKRPLVVGLVLLPFLESFNVVLLLNYDGTRYHGWQCNNNENAPTVEGEVLRALHKIHAGQEVKLTAASRTDKGVHARGQVVNYHISTLPFSGNFSRTAWALNRILNDDVRVLGYGLALTETFDPISDNVGKEYRYTIDTSPIQDPTLRLYQWHYIPKTAHNRQGGLDVGRMREAAKILEGCHDFWAYKGAFKGNERGKQVDMTCTLERIEVQGLDQGNHRLQITVEGDRFLYKMVRLLVGALVRVGDGEMSLQEVEQSLSQGSDAEQPLSGKLCAPASGLVLQRVLYRTELHLSRQGD